MKYWLMKSEPDVFSIDNLKDSPLGITSWEGVRNYQARNFMWDEMKKGDLVLFYHSNCNPPGVTGICTVEKESHPDLTAFDPESRYFDPKSHSDKPIWFLVDVKFASKFNTFIPLEKLRSKAELQHMKLLQRGNRLSVMPLQKKEFDIICEMGR